MSSKVASAGAGQVAIDTPADRLGVDGDNAGHSKDDSRETHLVGEGRFGGSSGR